MTTLGEKTEAAAAAKIAAEKTKAAAETAIAETAALEDELTELFSELQTDAEHFATAQALLGLSLDDDGDSDSSAPARNDAPNADRQAHTRLADAATLINAAARGHLARLAYRDASALYGTLLARQGVCLPASSAARTPTTWCSASAGPAWPSPSTTQKCSPSSLTTHKDAPERPTRRSRTPAASRCIRRH